MRFFPSFLTTPNYNPFLELIHFNRRPNPFAPLPFILFWLPKSQLLPHCASPFPYLHHTQPANPLPLPPSLTTHNPTVTPSISPWISHNLSPNTTSRICWLPYAVYHPALPYATLLAAAVHMERVSRPSSFNGETRGKGTSSYV